MSEPTFVTATRAGYDAIAQGYAEAFRASLANAPLDRALLAGFAELVRRDQRFPIPARFRCPVAWPSSATTSSVG